MRRRYLLLAILLAGLLGTAIPARAQSAQEFEIRILLKKNVYKVGEALKGNISINNLLPVTVPVSFEVRMYKNGKREYSNVVSVKTFLPGQLSFKFRSFMISEEPFKYTDKGNWEIFIKKLNTNEDNATRVPFRVASDVDSK